MNRQGFLLIVVALILVLTACTPVEPLITLDADKVSNLENECADIVYRHIDAWNTRNLDTLRAIYTDDVVHYDSIPAYEGVENVLDMAATVWMFFGAWKMEAGETYISKNACLGEWINWDIFGLTEDNKAIEYDLLETRDNKINFWKLYYGKTFYEIWDDPDYVNQELLAQFSSVWSQKNANKVAKIYADDAQIEDSLFGLSITGKDAINGYARSIISETGGQTWEMGNTFAEGEVEPAFKDQYPTPSHGAIFDIPVKDSNGETCKITMLVILTPSEDGKIAKQLNFYKADTLIKCGWAK